MSDIYLANRERQDLILSYVQDILNVVSGQDELAKTRIAANYFRTRASRYANLEFGASWPSWATSNLSAGTRTKNAANLVAYPSTDQSAARNDFDTYFYGMIVNGHVNSSGEFCVDYFDTDAEFSRETRDTYMLFPTLYFKYDFTNGEEIDLCLSRKTGYAPVGPAIKPNDQGLHPDRLLWRVSGWEWRSHVCFRCGDRIQDDAQCADYESTGQRQPVRYADRSGI